MEFIARTVTLPNGVRLPYVEHGSPTGLPIVFLHGVTDSWRSFEPVLPELPDLVRAFALTLRGHGDADRPETGYRPEDLASDVAEFMTAVGVRQAIVVGHSMGSSVAQRFAIDHPDRILGLVLVGARTRWNTHPGVLELGEYVCSSLTDPVDPAFVADFQQSTLAQSVPGPYFDAVVQESLKLPARVWKAAFVECILQADHSSRLAEIDVPTLILCGAHDEFAGDDQDNLAAAIRGSRLEVYPQAGHALHWEEPRRFAVDLMRFIDGLPSAASAMNTRAA
jgi:pimeloyl-ACP methyl ester carboxylesterase